MSLIFNSRLVICLFFVFLKILLIMWTKQSKSISYLCERNYNVQNKFILGKCLQTIGKIRRKRKRVNYKTECLQLFNVQYFKNRWMHADISLSWNKLIHFLNILAMLIVLANKQYTLLDNIFSLDFSKRWYWGFSTTKNQSLNLPLIFHCW